MPRYGTSDASIRELQEYKESLKGRMSERGEEYAKRMETPKSSREQDAEFYKEKYERYRKGLGKVGLASGLVGAGAGMLKSTGAQDVVSSGLEKISPSLSSGFEGLMDSPLLGSVIGLTGGLSMSSRLKKQAYERQMSSKLGAAGKASRALDTMKSMNQMAYKLPLAMSLAGGGGLSGLGAGIGGLPGEAISGVGQVIKGLGTRTKIYGAAEAADTGQVAASAAGEVAGGVTDIGKAAVGEAVAGATGETLGAEVVKSVIGTTGLKSLPSMLLGGGGAMGLSLASAGLGMIKAHKLKKLQAAKVSPFEEEKKYALSKSLKGFKSILMATQQIQPAEQLQLQVLEWIESHTSVIPLIHTELDFMRQEKEKTPVTAMDEYSKQTIGIEENQQSLLDKIQGGVNQMVSKFDPFTQVSDFFGGLMSGQLRLPKDSQEELSKAFGGDLNEMQNKIKKETKRLGLNADQYRLLQMDSQQILGMANTYEAKMLTILAASFDVQRLIATETVTIRRLGMGVGDSIMYQPIADEKSGFGKLLSGIKSIPSMLTNIPGINAIFNAAKTVFNLPKTIWGKVGGAVRGVKGMLLGKEYMKMQEDKEYLIKKAEETAVGPDGQKIGRLSITEQQKATEFVGKGLPNLLEEMRSIDVSQLEVLENIFFQSRQQTQALGQLSGLTELSTEYQETQKEKKEVGVWDPLLGQYLDKASAKRWEESRAEALEVTLENAFRDSIIGKASYFKDVTTGVLEKTWDIIANSDEVQQSFESRKRLNDEIKIEFDRIQIENELRKTYNKGIEEQIQQTEERNELRRRGELGGDAEDIITLKSQLKKYLDEDESTQKILKQENDRRIETIKTENDLIEARNKEIREGTIAGEVRALKTAELVDESMLKATGVISESMRRWDEINKTTREVSREKMYKFEEFFEKTTGGLSGTEVATREGFNDMAAELSELKSRVSYPEWTRDVELDRRAREKGIWDKTKDWFSDTIAGLKTTVLTGLGLAGGAVVGGLGLPMLGALLPTLIGPAIGAVMGSMSFQKKMLDKFKKASEREGFDPYADLSDVEKEELIKSRLIGSEQLERMQDKPFGSFTPFGLGEIEESPVFVQQKEILRILELIRNVMPIKVVSESIFQFRFDQLISDTFDQHQETLNMLESIKNTLLNTESIVTSLGSNLQLRFNELITNISNQYQIASSKFDSFKSFLENQFNNLVSEFKKLKDSIFVQQKESLKILKSIRKSMFIFGQEILSKFDKFALEFKNYFDLQHEDLLNISKDLKEQNEANQSNVKDIIDQIKKDLPADAANVDDTKSRRKIRDITGSEGWRRRQRKSKNEMDEAVNLQHGGIVVNRTFVEVGEENKREAILPLEAPESVQLMGGYINEALRTLTPVSNNSIINTLTSIDKILIDTLDFHRDVQALGRKKEFMKSAITIVLSGIIGPFGPMLSGAITNLLPMIGEQFTDVAKDVSTRIVNLIQNTKFFEFLTSSLKSFKKKEKTTESDKELVGEVEKIEEKKGLFSKMFGKEKPSKAQHGGIVTRETIVNVGEENKREAILPLETSESARLMGGYISEALRTFISTKDIESISSGNIGKLLESLKNLPGKILEKFTGSDRTPQNGVFGRVKSLFEFEKKQETKYPISDGSILKEKRRVLEEVKLKKKSKLPSDEPELKKKISPKIPVLKRTLGQELKEIDLKKKEKRSVEFQKGLDTDLDTIINLMGRKKEKEVELKKKEKSNCMDSLFNMFGKITDISGLLSSGLFTGLLDKAKSFIWKAVTGPAGPIMLLIGGIAWAISDAIDGFKEGGIGGAILGFFTGKVENSLMDTMKSVGKWALIGAGVGSFFPIVGTVVGGLLGAAFGALIEGVEDMFISYKKGGIWSAIKQWFFGDEKSGLGSAIKGMGKYAAMGALIGSVVPVIGTITGAIFGAILGGIVGFLGSDFFVGIGKGIINIWGFVTGASIIADMFDGKWAKRLAWAGSVVPWIGPLIGGFAGMLIDYITDIICPECIKKVWFLISGAYVIGKLFDTPRAKEYAKYGSIVPWIGPLVGGYVGSLVDIIMDDNTSIWEKVKNLWFLMSGATVIGNLFGTPRAKEYAKYGSFIPIIGPLIGGYIGSFVDIIMDDNTSTWEKIKNIWFLMSGATVIGNLFRTPRAREYAKYGSIVPWIGPLIGGIAGYLIDVIAATTADLGDGIKKIWFLITGATTIGNLFDTPRAKEYAKYGSFVPWIGPLIGGYVGSLVDIITDDNTSIWEKIKNLWFLISGATVIGNLFKSKRAKEYAKYGSFIPWIGPLIGGYVGSIVDYIADYVDSKGGIWNSIKKIWFLITGATTIGNLFGTPRAKEYAKRGSYVPWIGPLIGGFAGSIVDYIADDNTNVWEKIKKLWFLISGATVIGNLFGTPRAKEYAKYGSIVPWIGPLIGGLVGTVIDVLVDLFDLSGGCYSRIKEMLQKINPVCWIADALEGLVNMITSTYNSLMSGAIDLIPPKIGWGSLSIDLTDLKSSLRESLLVDTESGETKTTGGIPKQLSKTTEVTSSGSVSDWFSESTTKTTGGIPKQLSKTTEVTSSGSVGGIPKQLSESIKTSGVDMDRIASNNPLVSSEKEMKIFEKDQEKKILGIISNPNSKLVKILKEHEVASSSSKSWHKAAISKMTGMSAEKVLNIWRKQGKGKETISAEIDKNNKLEISLPKSVRRNISLIRETDIAEVRSANIIPSKIGEKLNISRLKEDLVAEVRDKNLNAEVEKTSEKLSPIIIPAPITSPVVPNTIQEYKEDEMLDPSMDKLIKDVFRSFSILIVEDFRRYSHEINVA